MKSIWCLAIVTASAIACARQHARPTPPSRETLVTVSELRGRMPAHALVVLDGVPLVDAGLDSLPASEVVSAQWMTLSDCRRAREDCKALVVARCSDGKAREGRMPPECPWVLPRR